MFSFLSKEPDSSENGQDGSKASAFFSGLMSNITEVTQKLKTTVEHVADAALGDFTREQQKFVASKHRDAVGGLPWSGVRNEEILQGQILGLSADKRNFLRDPPPQSKPFTFVYEQYAGTAKVLLDIDERLKQMRFELVPKVLSEEHFWRNYFYRVSLFRKAAEDEDSRVLSGEALDTSAPVVDSPSKGPESSHTAPSASDPLDDADEVASTGSFAADDAEVAAEDVAAELSQLGLSDAPKPAGEAPKEKIDDFDMLDDELRAELEDLPADAQDTADLDDEIDNMLKDS